MAIEYRDIHVLIPVSDYQELLKMRLHKGDLTWFIQCAVHEYVEKWKRDREGEERRGVRWQCVGGK
jgi:hypothetical protein